MAYNQRDVGVLKQVIKAKTARTLLDCKHDPNAKTSDYKTSA